MVYKQNIKRRSQKKLGHPITLKTPLHGEHPHLMHLIQKKKRKKETQTKHQKP
jgi:hypothetical protein